MKQNLKDRLKEMMDSDKTRQQANAIERASVELLGDYHFAYAQDAVKLAEVPLEQLDAFVARLKEIRLMIDLEYEEAIQQLTKGDKDE